MQRQIMLNYRIRDEVKTNHAAAISESASKKLYNSIVKIQLNGDIATGFYMKFISNDEVFKYLFTCNHVISTKEIESKKIITIFDGEINNEKKRSIILDENVRDIQTWEKPIDVTMIEILEGDRIPEDKFLLPDLNYKHGYNFYEKKDYYLAGYPSDFNGERGTSSGKIKQIINFNFFHTMDTESGSSGSPICLKDNICVIGIHKGGIEDRNTNFGIFIGYIITIFKKKDRKSYNYKSCINNSPRKYPLMQMQMQVPYKMLEKNKEWEDHLLSMLRLAEYYAFRNQDKFTVQSKGRFFSTYVFDDLNKESREKVLNILKESIELFKKSFKELISDFKEFKFPPQYEKEYIINYINQLKYYMKEGKEKEIYDDIIRSILLYDKSLC